MGGGYVGCLLMTERPILHLPLDKDGFFAVPLGSLTAEQEVQFEVVRKSAVAFADYADSTCGNPATVDPGAGYLCGGRGAGQPKSSPCNKFVVLGAECLIRKTKVIAKPHLSSCGKWDRKRAGDVEEERCPQGRYDDATIRFGVTSNPLGWSCRRCEYGEQKMRVPDSIGRDQWCKWHGMPIEQDACCADNTEDKDGEKPVSGGAVMAQSPLGRARGSASAPLRGGVPGTVSPSGVAQQQLSVATQQQAATRKKKALQQTLAKGPSPNGTGW
jgi:hypothetical protein